MGKLSLSHAKWCLVKTLFLDNERYIARNFITFIRISAYCFYIVEIHRYFIFNRNYLRASRGIGSIFPIRSSENKKTDRPQKALSKESEYSFSVPELRQRDIMSFAYQVAKGMKYLSDLKVSLIVKI